jgi:hypothetical protein
MKNHTVNHTKFAVTLFAENDTPAWEAFIESSNNGTIFHTRKFLAYHPQGRFKDHSLVFFDKGRRVAQFPAVEFLDDNRRVLISHRGASYGGCVVKSNLSLEESFRLVDSLIAYAGESGFDAIDITPPPLIYLRKPSNYLDFSLVQNGFTYRKREVSSVVPLDFNRDHILYTFDDGSRRAVRRAQKLGVVVCESQDYAGFYAILKKNLRLRHGVSPTHSLEELMALREMFPDAIRLFAAYHEKTMVAGVVMFACNPKVVLAFYISHDEQYQQYRGVNLLFHEIINWSISQGYQFLDFGIFTVNEEPNWGLARFKESFGALGVFRDSLHYSISHD